MSLDRDFFADVRTAKDAFAGEPEYKHDKIADGLKYRVDSRVLATARAELAIDAGWKPRVEGWPAGVVARYVSVGGAPLGLGVDITLTAFYGPRDHVPSLHSLQREYDHALRVVDPTYTATCLGCGESDTTEYSDVDVTKLGGHIDQTGAWNGPKPWAQKHAEKCRAVPKPEAQS